MGCWREIKIYSQPILLLAGVACLLVSREWLLEFGAGIKGSRGKEVLKMVDVYDPLQMGASGARRVYPMVCCLLGIRLGD